MRATALEDSSAELCAAFLRAALGVEPTVRRTDYIASWLEMLREDNRAIARAASQASKAADYIVGFLTDPAVGIAGGDGECEAA
ncbi:hypothetical protein AC629_00490 [Bradyrhizobium sp. NAS80.1]|nr:hypothetical protein AC629_00490 [Bradyrhizobium sp. NAS80.1]